jgi:hypothetical protein
MATSASVVGVWPLLCLVYDSLTYVSVGSLLHDKRFPVGVGAMLGLPRVAASRMVAKAEETGPTRRMKITASLELQDRRHLPPARKSLGPVKLAIQRGSSNRMKDVGTS